MRLGVFGGTFDPIHEGHLAIAGAADARFRFDRLLFVPASTPPHKVGREITSPFHRFAMAAVATAGRETWALSTIEVAAPSRPYSVDTVATLASRYPGAAPLYFLIGADSFEDLPLWHEYLRLVESCHIIVSARPGYEPRAESLDEAVRRRIVDLRGTRPGDGFPAAPDTETRIYLTEDVHVDVSSTDVRQAARAGGDLAPAVPGPVADYIRKHRLYGRENE